METKKCPFCAEEILFDAKKCKHCNEIIDEELSNRLNTKKSYFSLDTIVSIFIIIAFFLPWFDFKLFTLSGYDIPNAISKLNSLVNIFSLDSSYSDLSTYSVYVYLILILAIVSLIGSFFKTISIFTSLLSGTYTLFLISILVSRFSKFLSFDNSQIGIWITAIGIVILILSALSDLSELIYKHLLKEYFLKNREISKTNSYLWNLVIIIIELIVYIYVIVSFISSLNTNNYIKETSSKYNNQNTEESNSDYSKNENTENNSVENNSDYYIRKLIESEDEKNIEGIKSAFSDNLVRYWDLKYPSMYEVEKRYRSIWSKTVYSKNEVEYITDKGNNIYLFYIKFTFTNRHNITKTINTRVWFVLDSIGKISETYGD